MLKYLKFYKVLKCSKELDKISKAKSESERRELILKAKDCLIEAIAQIAKNCLFGNIPLKACDFQNLKKYKQVLRQISNQNSTHQKRKYIAQRGGFLSLLIPPALSLIASLIGEFVGKRINKS